MNVLLLRHTHWFLWFSLISMMVVVLYWCRESFQDVAQLDWHVTTLLLSQVCHGLIIITHLEYFCKKKSFNWFCEHGIKFSGLPETQVVKLLGKRCSKKFDTMHLQLTNHVKRCCQTYVEQNVNNMFWTLCVGKVSMWFWEQREVVSRIPMAFLKCFDGISYYELGGGWPSLAQIISYLWPGLTEDTLLIIWLC